MAILNSGSLGATLDAASEALFFGHDIPDDERREVARWIAGRQGMEGSYSGMFAPTREDYESGIQTFTGERMTSRAGTGHVLGEEACRVLLLLDVDDPEVAKAVSQAGKGILPRLREHDASASQTPGMYCCGTCSVSLWRHLAAGGLDSSEARLARGLKALKSHRDRRGRWQVFPFYYTLLALSEIDLSASREECQYVATTCQGLLKRRPTGAIFDVRRRTVAERVLEKC